MVCANLEYAMWLFCIVDVCECSITCYCKEVANDEPNMEGHSLSELWADSQKQSPIDGNHHLGDNQLHSLHEDFLWYPQWHAIVGTCDFVPNLQSFA